MAADSTCCSTSRLENGTIERGDCNDAITSLSVLVPFHCLRYGDGVYVATAVRVGSPVWESGVCIKPPTADAFGVAAAFVLSSSVRLPVLVLALPVLAAVKFGSGANICHNDTESCFAGSSKTSALYFLSGAITCDIRANHSYTTMMNIFIIVEVDVVNICRNYYLRLQCSVAA